MLIKVEPAGFFMYTVQLIFDLDRPDSEDGTVRDYLTDNELEPRYQTTGEYEGRQSEVMQFGGCYLGRHLQSVGQIQRRAVEVELLTAEVENHLADLELLSDRAGTKDGSAVESAPALSEAPASGDHCRPGNRLSPGIGVPGQRKRRVGGVPGPGRG